VLENVSSRTGIRLIALCKYILSNVVAEAEEVLFWTTSSSQRSNEMRTSMYIRQGWKIASKSLGFLGLKNSKSTNFCFLGFYFVHLYTDYI